ncbi:MAG TPA: VanZ family protein [Solirubrobacterales bacterium]|nr:VanZ family protein [Solirubrobacterales bacterium]
MASLTAPSARRLAALLLPPLAWMAVIFVLSGQPSDEVDRAWWDVVLRKMAHVTEYAVLTALWWRALRALDVGRPLAGAIGIALLYAASDEWHQTFVDGRTGTPVDVLIDAVGMALAALVITVYARRRTRGPSRPMAA